MGLTLLDTEIRVGVDPGSRNLSITVMKNKRRFKSIKIDLCHKFNKRKRKFQLIHYKRPILPLVVNELITKYWDSIWSQAIVFIEVQKKNMIHVDFSLLLRDELIKRGVETYMVRPKDVKAFAKISVPGGWSKHSTRKEKAVALLQTMFGEDQFTTLNKKFHKKMDDVADSLLIVLYGDRNLEKLRAKTLVEKEEEPPKDYSFKNKPIPLTDPPPYMEVSYEIRS